MCTLRGYERTLRSAWMLLAGRCRGPLTSHAYGAGFEAMLFDWILGAAGLAMIIPAFVPSRWWARDYVAESEVTGVSEFISSLAGTTESQAAAKPADYP